MAYREPPDGLGAFPLEVLSGTGVAGADSGGSSLGRRDNTAQAAAPMAVSSNPTHSMRRRGRPDPWPGSLRAASGRPGTFRPSRPLDGFSSTVLVRLTMMSSAAGRGTPPPAPPDATLEVMARCAP